MKKILLTSKLTPPAVPRHAVDRTHICNQVFLSFGAKVVLVCAPAGFGKTTVMAQLLERYQQEGTSVAWLNLDDADNDLPRFLSYMALALHDQSTNGGKSGAGEATLPADIGKLSARLSAQLSANQSPFVLFFDEVEVIRDAAVLGFLHQMLARLPANVRVVMGSRTVPEVGLGRLRAHGQLLEVLPDQLRFSSDEVQLFLTQRRGLTLQPEQIQTLLQNTEGWPTALWLASVALEKRSNVAEFIAGFAGSDAAVADYLAEDVLARQTSEIRDFLLKTSILTQFDAALCNAICARKDSAELLNHLERSNLFLTLVDERHGQYRYHSLFRDFLRAQLARKLGTQVPRLHRVAAEWFLAQNRPIPAIEHALETGDLGFSLPLLERYAEAMLSEGRLRVLTRWLETLPATALDTVPRLRLIHIWALNLTRGPQEALALIELINPASLGEGAVLAQFHAMQPTFLGMRDRIDESYALGIDRLQVVKPEHGFPYAMLSQTLANDSMILGNYAEARRHADQARSALTGPASTLQMSIAGAVDGAIDLIQGRLQQALAELQLAAGISDEDLVQDGNRQLMPGVLLAEALYEAGRVERAETLLNLFVPLTQNLGLPDQLIIAHSVLARIVERQSDPQRSFELLAQLEALGHRLGLQRVVASARIEKASARLMRGDAAGAKELLDQAGDDAYWEAISNRSYIANDKITLMIGRLRWLIHTGSGTQALPLLKEQLDRAVAAQRNRRALKLRILLAEALHVDGQRKLAARTLSKALEFGSQEGFVSSFVEEGPRVEEMLRTLLQARQTNDGYRDGDPLRMHLLKIAGSRQEDTLITDSGLTEALTRKEQQILELLAQGHSNDSMAEKLFVSESTIRTHLRSINTKLQASNRMHALAIARRMRLLP